MERIGQYEILGVIGDGGMGTVYKGRDPRFDRLVAIKVLHPQLQRQPGVVDRFKTEAVIQAKLSHAHIVTVYDFIADDSTLAIVMEYIEGRPLDAAIRESPGGLPVAWTVSVVDQCLDAMAYAHRHGLVHRDLKPSNILVSDGAAEPRAKITDFGVAKVLGDDKLRTATGARMGTLAYMAPEHVQSPKLVDNRSDIYALGATLYEMLTGDPPFDAETEYALAEQIVKSPVPSPRRTRATVTPGIDAVVRQAMAKAPKERYQTCDEMRAALVSPAAGDAFARSMPVEPSPVVPRPDSATEGGGARVRIPTFAILGSALVLVMIVTLLAFARRDFGAPSGSTQALSQAAATPAPSVTVPQPAATQASTPAPSGQPLRPGGSVRSGEWVLQVGCVGAAVGSPDCEDAGVFKWLEAQNPQPPVLLAQIEPPDYSTNTVVVDKVLPAFPGTPLVGPFGSEAETKAWVGERDRFPYLFNAFRVSDYRDVLQEQTVQEVGPIQRVQGTVSNAEYGNHTGVFTVNDIGFGVPTREGFVVRDGDQVIVEYRTITTKKGDTVFGTDRDVLRIVMIR